MPENECFNSVPIPIPFLQWNWWELSFFGCNFENMDGIFEWLRGYMYTFGTKIHVFLKGKMLCNDIYVLIVCLINKGFKDTRNKENWIISVTETKKNKLNQMNKAHIHGVSSYICCVLIIQRQIISPYPLVEFK